MDQLDPIDVAILREAVRLDGLSESAALRINVGVAQVVDLQGRKLLRFDAVRKTWHATVAGRRAINE
ncbi:hypothetical protein [Duganella vulcania]|uniref:Uncharacterized protein n=1 Tax=Duganella vulcania TaxID=2692166 RepID=A0A845GGN6_9BURK|nr:hypothetical protein [Duganella vulcania]MYM92582.1 hypothetical protein [Duganella vulcania]